MGRRFALGVTLSLALMGCASVVPKDFEATADRTLALADIWARPEAFRGRTMILGGEILQVTPKPSGTEVEVLERPLGQRDRPERTDASQGRFLVMMEGFLDPAVYRAGREVTVVGDVEGVTARPIGEVTYTFPVLRGRYLYLWPMREPVVYEPVWPYPYWGDRWWYWHRHRFGLLRFRY
jgi:outer membrane lipoprotein